MPALTKEDIAFIKKCTHVCFRYDNVRSTIEAVKKSSDNLTETRHTIEVTTRTTSCTRLSGKVHSAFCMIMFAHHDPHWMTIVSLLRPGDDIKLLWEADYGTSPVLTDHGLHSDALFLCVTRKGKTMTFMIAKDTARDGISRMCICEKS